MCANFRLLSSENCRRFLPLNDLEESENMLPILKLHNLLQHSYAQEACLQ